MKRSERAALTQKILDEHVPDPQIPLNYTSPFTLLCAVILSAQCTDKRVNEVTPKLFAVADTPEKMVKLDLQTLEDMIRPCGLAPAKAKGLKGSAEAILREHNGEVPGSMEELEKLPSVGHKTASVILCHIFKIPAVPVDTHVHRVMKRWRLSSGKSVRQTEADFKKLFSPENWERLHLQMIHFGRNICTAKKHSRDSCPACSQLDCR